MPDSEQHEHPVCPGCGGRHPPKTVLVEGAELPPHMEKLAAMFGASPGTVLLPQQALSGFFPGLFGPSAASRPVPPNPKTAFLRQPMFTKSRPLSADELKSRWTKDGKRAHHRACRRLAAPVPFLDYVSCSKCNVALNEDDVFWKTVYTRKKKKKKKRKKGQ